jgi:Ca2+:H+ antiporter
MRQDHLASRLLFVLLILGPLVVALDRADGARNIMLFPLAAAALIPLAWLIGEATEQAAHYTGPGIGGFLNASFGNAPELIIALIAISDGLTDVVRASLTGSVIGNLLLVLGFVLLLGRPGTFDRSSGVISVGTVLLATLVLLVAAVPGFHGDPDRRSLAELSLPLAVGLLAVRIVVNARLLRRQRIQEGTTIPADGWSLRAALIVLGVATVVTAFVTDTLVGSLEDFAREAHLSDFFVAIVIVAIVGNITEHGSAVLLARRGQVGLATQIGLASASQVAAFLIPLVAILSWTIEPLALSLRPIELGGMGAAGLLAGVALAPGRTSRAGGVLLLGAYCALVVGFYVAGDR